MEKKKALYQSYINPFLIRPNRPLPEEMAVIGAGSIGPDIGYYLRSAMPDKSLYLVDMVEEPLKRAETRLRSYAEKGVARKKMSEEQARAVLKNIVYTTDYEHVKHCTLVIEAATENLNLKQEIFHTLEGIVGEGAILTSNTSSIPADRIFSKMKNPERCTVTHFFAPAWFSLGVEVLNWEGIATDVLDYLFWFFAQTGKAPVITDNVICFMLNRIFENWVNEAGYLLVDDVDGVKIITIRRPQALNAINEDLNHEILSVLKSHADDPSVRGFVITGYGTRAFSAGADIGIFPKTLGKREAAVKLARDSSVVHQFIDQMDKPVVAAVNGMTLGGEVDFYQLSRL